MSSQVEMFNTSVYVSEQLNRQMVNMVQDVAHRCVMECASRYGFDGEEALRFLNLMNVKMERKTGGKAKAKTVKVKAVKAAFPLPYNGEFNEQYCFALRQNNGLYTQCTGARKGENNFCKSCASTLQKTGAEVPEYGTIQMRQAVGIFEYVDPKGRKPIAYTKVMKKYKLTQENVLEEAGKLNININSKHFEAPEAVVKRGRPAAEKEPKVKGTKGRPKKSKKVLEIEGNDDDLFATLVANANIEADEMDVPEEPVTKKSTKKGKSDEEKEAERLKKEEEKEAKKLAAEKAKAEKEAEKEAKKKLEEEEKAAKKLAAEKAKAEKEAEKEAKKLAAEKAKAEKESSKKAPKKAAVQEDDEPDVVKKIEFEGKKYLKSKKTGIVYDYIEYTKNGEQVVVGKWNEKSNKIDFNETEDEEEEEEYDM